MRKKQKTEYIPHGTIRNRWLAKMSASPQNASAGPSLQNHDYIRNVPNGKVKCKSTGCKCPTYTYIPVQGSQDFKCSCKHSYQQHDFW